MKASGIGRRALDFRHRFRNAGDSIQAAGHIPCGLWIGLICLLAGCAPKRDTMQNVLPAGTPIALQEVAQAAGIDLERNNGAQGKRWMPETMSGGGAFLDYDKDGWLDALILDNPVHPSVKTPRLRLYRNRGDGTFTEVTATCLPASERMPLRFDPMGVAVGDFDNDGYDDLFIAALYQSVLLRNREGRAFENVTTASGIKDTGWATSAAWLDYNRDGKLDLFVCHYLTWSPEKNIVCGTTVPAYCRPQEYSGESCRLYRNEGQGRFRDVTRESGVYNPHAKSLGVCVCDMDDNGFPDLIVANDTEPNFLLKNNGNGAFTDIGAESGVALDDNGKARAGMGLDMADTQCDGRQSLAIGNFTYEGIALYEMGSALPFEERARQAGVYVPSYPYITFGLFFADFDNDSLPDLFVTNGHIEDNIAQTNPGQTFPQPNLLFENTGKGVFREIGKEAGAGVSAPMVGRGACRGDFNNDGKPDILLIPNLGKVRLLRNATQTSAHWTQLQLVGTKSNRNGYGAKVTVEAGGIRQTALHRSGSSYLSAHDSRLHFGLGKAAQIDRVTVRWPNGVEQVWTNLPADRVTVLTEGQTATK
jgi:hypothetical protein